jgi:hypothetical protein
MVCLWGGTWGHNQHGGYDLAADDYVKVSPSAKENPAAAAKNKDGWAEAYNPVYDPIGKRCIAFGGVMAAEMHCWEPASDRIWNDKAATPGPGKSFPTYPTAAAVYEPESKLVVCFTYTAPHGPPASKRGPTETWTYDPATFTWRNAKPAAQPQVKASGGLAYDSLNRAIILSIGRRKEDPPAEKTETQTWRYDVKANTWTDLTPAGGGPGGPLAYRLSFDPEHNACLAVFPNAGGMNELWAYRYKNVPVGTAPGEARR